jgi:hypothetical protein
MLLGKGCARFLILVLILGGVLIGSTGATAGPASSMTVPFTFDGINPCTGETITGTGNLHLLTTGNVSDSGNTQFHTETGFSGVQAVTTFPFAPKKYVIVDQEGYTNTFDSDGMPAQDTLDPTFQLVRSGEGGTVFPDDDFYLHVHTHITANANGTVTADKIDTDMRCR